MTQLISVFDGTLVRVGDEVKRFDNGAAIPDYADQAHVEVLKARGMIAEGEPVVGVEAPSGPVPFDVDADAEKSRRTVTRAKS